MNLPILSTDATALFQIILLVLLLLGKLLYKVFVKTKKDELKWEKKKENIDSALPMQKNREAQKEAKVTEISSFMPSISMPLTSLEDKNYELPEAKSNVNVENLRNLIVSYEIFSGPKSKRFNR